MHSPGSSNILSSTVSVSDVPDIPQKKTKNNIKNIPDQTPNTYTTHFFMALLYILVIIYGRLRM